MTKRIILVTALFSLLILLLPITHAVTAKMEKPILVLEGAPGTYSAGKVEAALKQMGYRGEIFIVRSEEDLNKAWAKRNKYAIMLIAYHAFRDNAFLRNWLAAKGEEIKSWVYDIGGTILACTKDAEDDPLSALFGLTKISVPPEVDEIPLTPNTPFAAGVPEGKLSSSGGFCTFAYAEPLPSWVQYVVATKDGYPAIVAGKYGKGCLILGPAEWVDTTDAYKPGTEDWDTFWTNLFNRIDETSEWVPPPPDVYTKEEVDRLIEEAINRAVEKALSSIWPTPTTAVAFGLFGIMLGIIAIAISVVALRLRYK